MNIDWNEQSEAYVDDLLVSLVADASVDHSSFHLHSQVGVQLVPRFVQEAVRSGHHEALVPSSRTTEAGGLLRFVTNYDVKLTHPRIQYVSLRCVFKHRKKTRDN